MLESEFQDLVDEIYFQLEDQIDASGVDLDYETSAGVMTITCESNGSKIILSRQPATREIWVAARSGGYHFRQDKQEWVCASGETLPVLLQRVIQDQSGETVAVKL